MAGGVTVKVRFNKLPDAADNTKKAVGDAVTKFFGDVEASADAATPVDTGMLKNSRVTESSDAGGSIVWSAEHAIYVHEGTRYMSARPFARDAFEKSLPSLQQALDSIEGKIV